MSDDNNGGDTAMDRAAELKAHKLRLAAEADRRIKSGAHWEDWCQIADGFLIGRIEAFQMSGTNNENDQRYKRAFKRWMDDNPWSKNYERALRSHLFWVAENRSEIDVWRRTLAQNEREKLNHPSSVKRRFDAAQRLGGKDPNAPKKPNDKEALIARNAELEAENAALKRKYKEDGGSLFNLVNDPLPMIAKIMGEEMGRTRLMLAQKEIAKEISRLTKLYKAQAG
jgi:hypothetical protein